MIIAIGVDLAEVSRVEALLASAGERFVERVFTSIERQYCDGKANRAERYAARFAAKEAVMKALGTGWSRGVRWRDIEVDHEAGGRPLVRLQGAAAEHARRLGIQRWSISLTHTHAHALAQVVAESAP